MKKNKLILVLMLALFAATNTYAQKPILLQTSVGNALASTGAVVGNTFYFPKVGPGINVIQLWKTDGTIAGTKMVKDSLHGSIVGLVNIKDTLRFIGQTTFSPTSPLALWKSDGTKGGTKIVRIFTGAGVGLMKVIDNIGYFTLANAIWKTDGTAAGTLLVKASFGLSSVVYQSGSEVVFFGNPLGSTYRGLWKIDGTGSAVLVKDSLMRPASGHTLGEYATTTGASFFMISEGATQNLWRTDGTKAGTFIVINGTISNLAGLGNTLYFINFVSFKMALWKSNGTVAGTVAVSGIGNIGSGLKAMGSDLYLGGKDDYNFEPYKSDGSATGSVLLKDINNGTTASNPMYFTRVGNTMTFVANDGINGNQIWKTDGTPAGTVMAYAASDAISNNVSPTVRIPFNKFLIFVHGGGTTGDLYALMVDSSSASPKIPNAPTNLILTPQKKSSKGKMKLNWTDNSPDELGFIIERSMDGNNFTKIDSVSSNISTFTDTGLNASTKYYYRVAAYNAAGNSAYSNTLDATTLGAISNVIKTEDLLKIYPNPSSGKYEISFSKPMTESLKLKVTDIFGKEVYSETLPNGVMKYSLDLSILQNGIYILYSNNTFSQKIIIQK